MLRKIVSNNNYTSMFYTFFRPLKNKLLLIFCISFVQIISLLPEKVYQWLCRQGGRIADSKKGGIARKALKIAFPEKPSSEIDQLAEQAAIMGMHYMLVIARLNRCHYQLHNLDVIKEALGKNKGIIIAAPHLGPPDLATMILRKANLPVQTMIGAGKQKPWLNELGRYLLRRVNVPFIAKGNPLAVLKALRQNQAIFQHCDMRSSEAPVQFFGMDTTAPASLIKNALMMDIPIVFHYCTLEQTPTQPQLWHCHFEVFPITKAGNQEQDIAENLQRLFHRMEAVIRQQPQLWIWHYDRFQLKHK